MITLTAVVPATDRPRSLERCTAAIAAAADGPDEVIVVDGPSTLSAAGARNRGVAGASGDVIVFVDADVEVCADAFTRLRAAFAAEPDLDGVFGSYDDRPAARTVVSSFRNLLHHHVHQTSAGSAETFWTGLGAVRRDRFLAAGGFDAARYPLPSIEDIELGDRLAARGARIILDPTVQGTHLKVWTLRSMLWTDFARRGIPWVALQVRNRRLSSAMNLGWRHRVSAATCAAGLGAVVAGQLVVAVVALLAMGVLNRDLYSLVARRQGAAHAVLSIGLHVLHHLVSIAAVPVGVALALAAWQRRRAVDAPAVAT